MTSRNHAHPSTFPAEESALARSLASSPRTARWILPALAAAFRGADDSTLEPRARALLLLRVAAVESSPYWRMQWEHAARTVGVADDQVALVVTDGWDTATSFTERERAAVRWADRVARRLAQRDVGSYDDLSAVFDADEIVEITMAAALAAMAVRITNSLRISPEAPTGLGPDEGGLDEAVFATWSRRLFDQPETISVDVGGR